ncbi:MAG: PHB depolymerase family esterase [Casimicrobiaceae bacterium]
MVSLWSRAKAFFARLWRDEPEPGRFETGSKFSMAGYVSTAPFVWPTREYLVYIPKGRPLFKRAPLLVLCHGCKQTPEEFAQGTRITALADRTGCVVLLPRQKREANAWFCWNWFESRTSAGQGETAIVAAQIRHVIRRYRIDRKRVAVAGMSAGGALAAALGVRYPRLISSVAVHSGLACGAARSALTAIPVMQHGPESDVVKIGAAARAEAGSTRVVVPLLAIHGDADRVVAPMHSTALVRQYLALNGFAVSADLPPPDTEIDQPLPDGRMQKVREWKRDGQLIARLITVSQLGHAWSGGDATLAYNDAAAPDATTLMGSFFGDGLS